MKLKQSILWIAGCGLFATGLAAAEFSIPPQNQGLPYTRSSQAFAFQTLNGKVGVYPGSRYGYINNKRFRLDEDHMDAESKEINQEIWVPLAFARLLHTPESVREADTEIPELSDRWVYTVPNKKRSAFSARNIRKIKGVDYVPLKHAINGSGLELFDWSKVSGTQRKNLITLFDTPDKFADPSIIIESVPILKRQGKWTDHVKVSPEDLKKIESDDEYEWPMTPVSSFDYSKFNSSLLGSKVPAPGVYPRLLFSPADIPAIQKRLRTSKVGQKALLASEYLLNKSFLNPKSDDGKVFDLLASEKYSTLKFRKGVNNWTPIREFEGYKRGIYASHTEYYPNALTSIAFYAMMTDNDSLGRKAAAALVNYNKLLEPIFDRFTAKSDSELGSDSATSGMATYAWRRYFHPNQHIDLAIGMDIAGAYMTPEQKAWMYQFIAKQSYGRRSFAQDGPKRFRDINWMSWDFAHFLCNSVIEGQKGFDPEVYFRGRESIAAFCEWGVNRYGTIYESNGKTGGAFHSLYLAMVTLARRDVNYFGHPHFQKITESQSMHLSPNGRVTVNSGTEYLPFIGSSLGAAFINELKGAYPNSRATDYMLTNLKVRGKIDDYAMYQFFIIDQFDPESYKKELPKIKGLRLPGPSYTITANALYSFDFPQTSREAAKLPLDFNDPVHGVFSAYSDRSPEAAWMHMLARPDHYLGAGHHHADCGMIHFSALGVDWIASDPFNNREYDGYFHNLVQIDGRSTPEKFHARGKYLGAKIAPDLSVAAVDQTYAYTWMWNTQPEQTWEEMQLDRSSVQTPLPGKDWELEPSEDIKKFFYGTHRYRFRPWWPTYIFSNFIATSRAKYNPVEYAFRSVALVRGKHPWGLVIDDLKKDDQNRTYTWSAMPDGGVYPAAVSNVPSNGIVLAQRPVDRKFFKRPVAERAKIVPQKGEPLLLALFFDPSGNPVPKMETLNRMHRFPEKTAEPYDRLAADVKGKEAHIRTFLLPYRHGEAMPEVSWNESAQRFTVKYPGQIHEVKLNRTNLQTTFEMKRK